MRIEGKTALITGAGSGLGAAAARMIAAAGGRPIAVDLKPGDDVIPFIAGDVTRADQMQAAVDFALQRTGAIYILINCAGVAPAARVVGREGPANLDDFVRVIGVNLVGTFNAIRLAAAAMTRNEPDEEGERGVIVNTASVAAFDGQIGQAAYAASKGGIVSMTLPIARELARHAIRVMTIAPGIFDTPMMAAMSDSVRDSLGASVPFPARLGRPTEYAQLARQIIENPYLNGETIRLDGAIRMPPK